MQNEGEKVGGPPLTGTFGLGWTGREWEEQGVLTRSKAKLLQGKADGNTSPFSDNSSDAGYQEDIERLIKKKAESARFNESRKNE